MEQLSDSEQRVLFDTAVAGVHVLFTNLGSDPIDVVEIMVLPVAANTVQLAVDGVVITPLWNLGARQMMVDPGFILRKMGAQVTIEIGAATQVQVLLRWRNRGCQ